MSVSLGNAYISIVPTTKNMQKDITASLRGLDKVGKKAGDDIGKGLSTGVQGAGLGTNISGALGKTLKAGALSVGTAAGGLLATGITKGMGRLTGIENAQAKLRGLGHDAQSVDSIMSNALTSVKGTAFGLQDAATVAASAVAAGVKPGKELERTLKMVGDAATIAGLDMNSMGSIVNKVATSDMMQMDVANQLMDAGIPILQMVAKEMGVTAGEARDLASEGKISFETFQNALEAGVGGAALEAGNTFQGSMDNLGAAIGRAGAAFLEPGFKEAPSLIGNLTEKVDELTPKAKIAGVMVQDTFADLANLVGPLAGQTGELGAQFQSLIGPLGGALALSQFAKWKGLPDAMDVTAKRTLAAAGEFMTLRGAGTQAMNGIKNAGKGLLGFLGGPWGLAFTAAGLVVGGLAQEHLKAKAAEAEHKISQQELKGTLDQTTGAITAQTTELQRKRAEENGWIQTATNLGLSASVVTDAMNGSEAAMRRVEYATRAGVTQAVSGSDAWAEYGESFKQAGFDIETVSAAVNGNKDAIAELQGAGLAVEMTHIRKETEGARDSINGLSEGINGAAEDINAIQTETAREQLTALEDQVKTTKDALALLGDTDFSMVDMSTLSVSADSVTDDIRKKFEDLRIKVGEPLNGKVNLEFPDGVNIATMLDQIGIKLQNQNGYIHVNADDVQGAIAALDTMGIKTTTLPDGSVRIDSDAPEVIDRLVELNLMNKDSEGKVTINDNALNVEAAMNSLRSNVNAGAQGNARINHNFDSAAQSARNVKGAMDTIQSKTVEIRIQEWREYYSSGRASSSGGTSVGQHYAKGGKHGGYRLPATGPGTHKTDGFLARDEETGAPTAWLNAKEWVINQRSSDFYDRELAAINAGTFPKLPGFETGGVLKSAAEIKRDVAYMDGTPYVMGGWSKSAVDCSGAVSLVVNNALGRPDFESRMSTVTAGSWLDARGAHSGRGGSSDIQIGWWDRGGGANGHTALRLQDGTFIESGGNTGGGFTIGRSAGPLDGRGFTNWRHFKGSVLKHSIGVTESSVGDSVGDSMVTGSNTVSVALTPEQAARATFAKSMGEQSYLEMGTSALFDFFGMGDSSLLRLLTSKPSDMFSDSDITTHVDRELTEEEIKRLNRRGTNFDRGGIGRGAGVMLKDIIKPERTLDAQQTAAFDHLVYDELPKRRGETVVHLDVDPSDLISAAVIQKMINQGVDGLRMELKGRRPVAAAATRGGVM